MNGYQNIYGATWYRFKSTFIKQAYSYGGITVSTAPGEQENYCKIRKLKLSYRFFYRNDVSLGIRFHWCVGAYKSVRYLKQVNNASSRP